MAKGQRRIMKNELVQVLMRRENMSEPEVCEWIQETVDNADGEGPEELLHYEFGLEPDYIFDLMEFM